MYIKKNSESVQCIFQKTKINKHLFNFAKNYDNNTLLGINCINMGDSFYINKNYNQSINYYQKAANYLINTLMYGRTQIGYAVSFVYINNNEKAIKILENLKYSRNINMLYQNEGIYHLAFLELEKGNKNKAKSLFKEIIHNNLKDFWEKKAKFILNII